MSLEKVKYLLAEATKELESVKAKQASIKPEEFIDGGEVSGSAEVLVPLAEKGIENLLENVLDAALRLTNCHGAAITVLDDDCSELIVRSAKGFSSEFVVGMNVPLEGSKHGFCIATQEIVNTRPVYRGVEEKTKRRYGSLLICPLVVDEQAIGTVTLGNDETKQELFEDYAEEVILLIAPLAGQLILWQQTLEAMIAGSGEWSSTLSKPGQERLKLLQQFRVLQQEFPAIATGVLSFVDEQIKVIQTR